MTALGLAGRVLLGAALAVFTIALFRGISKPGWKPLTKFGGALSTAGAVCLAIDWAVG